MRDLEGTWTGARVGEAAPLRVGMADQVVATLEIEEVSLTSFRARLTTDDDLFSDASIQPVAGAEADQLAGITWDSSPDRVFLAFAPTTDGGGDALVVTALYVDPRVEVRILRGGDQPLYGLFRLSRK